MKIDVTVKNFGKIKEANLQIRPFTVIAGKNASGKSFITKALYSFFRSINKDFVTIEAAGLIRSINEGLTYYLDSIRLSAAEIEYADLAKFAGRDLEYTAFQVYGDNTFTSQLNSAPKLVEKLNTLKLNLGKYLNSVESKKKFKKIEEHVGVIQMRIRQLEGIILRPGDVYANAIQSEFKNSLKENFQITNLGQLVNFSAGQEDATEFEFSDVGSIKIVNDGVDFKLRPKGIDTLQQLSNIVYLESPLYWRLKPALETVNDFNNFRYFSRFKKQDTLSGVPQHFYDLLNLLRDRVKYNSGQCDFAMVRDDINTQIGGQVIVNTVGDVVYKDFQTGKELNLYTTATGIVNLGVISMLIERNVISSGSFIIVDEPEVNLHPAWQQVLITALYNLSLSGINVIIATHSLDMIRGIEEKVNDYSGDVDEHFGINQLTTDGMSFAVGDNTHLRIAYISEDLGENFFKLQMGL